MEVTDWSNLPPEVLTYIFHYIPLHCLLYTIPAVCQSWWNVLKQMSFWWKRLSLEGIISRDHRLDLINNIDQKRITKLLKGTAQQYLWHLHDLPVVQDTHFKDGETWKIDEQQIEYACHELMFVTPRLVVLDLNCEVTQISDLDILLILLSQTNCTVIIGDDCSYKFATPTMDDYLKFLITKNMKCRIIGFKGCVKSIDNLPKSIRKLYIAIPCNADGSALDPGIARLQETLPALRTLAVHVRCGTDVSLLPHLPSLRNNYNLGYGVSLCFSNVGLNQKSWMHEVFQALQPMDTQFNNVCSLERPQIDIRPFF